MHQATHPAASPTVGAKPPTLQDATCATETRQPSDVCQVGEGRHSSGMPRVLDPCCGSRMFWFDKTDPRAIFGDQRAETVTVKDSSQATGQRTIRVAPDSLMDFRSLPFSDNTFRLVAFDPPHLTQAAPRSWMRAKYGVLGPNWSEDLRLGFAECFRVLEPEGVLVFKWSASHVPLREVLALTPHQPLFGQLSGRKGLTHWLVFMKPAEASDV